MLNSQKDEREKMKKRTEDGRTLLETLAVLSIVGMLIVGAMAGFSWAMRKARVENNLKEINLIAVDIFSEPVHFARTKVGQGLIFRNMNTSPFVATKVDEKIFSVTSKPLERKTCLKMYDQAQFYPLIDERTFEEEACVENKAVFYYKMDNGVSAGTGCGAQGVWNEVAGRCCPVLVEPQESPCRVAVKIEAEEGKCPSYEEKHLQGTCGTNGYCNNGNCVPCPAALESCAIEADIYDENSCLSNKKVVCPVGQTCENGACVACSTGEVCGCTNGTWDEVAGMCCEAVNLPTDTECLHYALTPAEEGVCPSYETVPMKGPCGTNGYCDAGICVECTGDYEQASLNGCRCQTGYEYCNGECHAICSGSGMTGARDPETCNCLCLEGTNAETCACPAGYIYLNGSCQKFECKGGPTNFNCYINGLLCGYNCDSTGHSCASGTCHSGDCPTDMNFKQATSPWVWAAGYHYGCNIPGTECYKLTPHHTYSYCFAPTSTYTCCIASLEGECYSGTCDASQCPAHSIFYHATNAITPFAERGGCLFDNGVRCYPSNATQTLWFCYASTGIICDQNCTNPPDCNGNCAEKKCMDGQTYDEETGYCCIDDVCCDYNDQQMPTCFQSGLRCARRCSGLPQNCNYGNCYDPGCAAWGMVHGYAPSKQLMGCLDPELGEKGMFCIYNVDYQVAECFYNGQSCGRRCHYNGTDCGEVFLKECSAQNVCLQNGAVVENCTCTGQITTLNNVSYCCPAGHTFVNGGCTLITCPEGQEVDENGICQDKS